MLSERSDRSEGGVRWWLVLLVLVLVLAGGVTVWLVKGHTPAPRSPVAAGSVTASSAACRPVDLEGIDPAFVGAWRKAVGPVHQAACAGDFGALARLLGGESASHFESSECTGCDGADLVGMWNDEFRFDGSQLARALETRPVQDQGGLTYRRGDTLVVFARGTHELPISWSAFFMDCHEDDRCQELEPVTGAP